MVMWGSRLPLVYPKADSGKGLLVTRPGALATARNKWRDSENLWVAGDPRRRIMFLLDVRTKRFRLVILWPQVRQFLLYSFVVYKLLT